MKTLTFMGYTLGIGISLAACGHDPLVLGELIRGDEGGDEELNDAIGCDTSVPGDLENPCFPVVSIDALDLPNAIPYAEEEILLPYCGACHEAPADAGGLSAIGDLDALISLGLIVPGDKYSSALYTRMADRTMPPVSVDNRPTDPEILYVGSVIDALDD